MRTYTMLSQRKILCRRRLHKNSSNPERVWKRLKNPLTTDDMDVVLLPPVPKEERKFILPLDSSVEEKRKKWMRVSFVIEKQEFSKRLYIWWSDSKVSREVPETLMLQRKRRLWGTRRACGRLTRLFPCDYRRKVQALFTNINQFFSNLV